MVFQCSKCGLCCQSLKRSELYKDLDDGTGICIYFDKLTNLCKIYDHRPEKCNVEAMYKYFCNVMNYEEYIKANMDNCAQLRRERKICQK